MVRRMKKKKKRIKIIKGGEKKKLENGAKACGCGYSREFHTVCHSIRTKFIVCFFSHVHKSTKLTN